VDERTDVRTHVRTYVQTDRHLRPALLGRLCQKVDLKMQQKPLWLYHQFRISETLPDHDHDDNYYYYYDTPSSIDPKISTAS